MHHAEMDTSRRQATDTELAPAPAPSDVALFAFMTRITRRLTRGMQVMNNYPKP